jgi:hypothetical protein
VQNGDNVADQDKIDQAKMSPNRVAPFLKTGGFNALKQTSHAVAKVV